MQNKHKQTVSTPAAMTALQQRCGQAVKKTTSAAATVRKRIKQQP
jgi:hypothetical protein